MRSGYRVLATVVAALVIASSGCVKPEEPAAGTATSGGATSAGRAPSPEQAGLKPATGDDAIKQAVEKKLAADPALKGEKVEVAVKDGRVALTGTVSSQEKKIALEDAVREVPDVFGVDTANLTAQ